MFIKSIKTVCTGAIAGLLFASVVTAGWIAYDLITDATSEGRVFQKVGGQTFKILNPDNLNSGGTGFSIKAPSGVTYTLTNSHVCRVSHYPYMVAKKGERVMRLQIVDISTEADLCLMEGMPGAEGLELASGSHIGERAFLVGHPRLQPVTLKTGFLGDISSVMVSYCEISQQFYHMGELEANPSPFDCIKNITARLATIDSMPGNSGSAVTDRSGDVIGVLFAGNGYGLSILVPLETVRDYLSAF